MTASRVICAGSRRARSAARAMRTRTSASLCSSVSILKLQARVHYPTPPPRYCMRSAAMGYRVALCAGHQAAASASASAAIALAA